MKKNKWMIRIASISILVLVVMFSCKKRNTVPTLTLNGASTTTLCIGGTYTDAGATAVDAYGDNIDVVVTGTVDVNTYGSYTVTYTATDKNGNVTTVLTTVAVQICASNLLGAYKTTGHNCTESTTGIDLINEDQNIVASPNENEFIITDFNFAVDSVTCSLNGAAIMVPSNTFSISVPLVGSIDVTISGTGTVNNAATEMTINYDYTSSLVNGSCTATYVKQ